MKTILLIMGLLTIPAVAQTPFGQQRMLSSPLMGGNDTRANITVRDYIAIQAMTGLLSGARGWQYRPDEVAAKAYAIADGMLIGRGQ